MKDLATEFSGKVALVTGTSGIGRASAFRLARAGAVVLACGIDEKVNAAMARLAADDGLKVTVAKADVSDSKAVESVIGRIEREFGGLDIIVNAAAAHPYGTVTSTDEKTWNHCLAVNVGSIYLTAHFGIPLMEKRGGGAIVSISSVQGYNCQPNVAAYVASKGAIHALTRAMAVDHAKQGIRVNSISPGSIRTPLLEMAARVFDGPDADVDAVIRRFGEAHLLGRVGEPEEVAEMVAFLASDRAAFSTGGDYLVDGGLMAGVGVK
ncbi:MAG: SDR family oxidoreductase [Rhizobiaceae bacterium]|nr:SDR family oxidoreductase [Rhizobiaceae bacterium]